MKEGTKHIDKLTGDDDNPIPLNGDFGSTQR